MKQDEIKAFVSVFMRTLGSSCNSDAQVVDFIEQRENGTPDDQLYQKFSEIYSSVLDALDIWETARGVK